MVTLKALNTAKDNYDITLYHYNNAIKHDDDATQLVHTLKHYAKKGIIKHSVFDAFKAQTLEFRRDLSTSRELLKREKVDAYKAYNTVRKEYNKLTVSERELQQALNRLTPAQVELVKAHYTKEALK